VTVIASTKTARAHFEEAFLEILQARVHPDYQRDRQIKGYFVEFRRSTPEGFFLSYNFVRVKLDYTLSFAVLLSPHQSAPRLHSPLTFGSRFDTNRFLSRQYLDDLNVRRGDPDYPPYLWSFGTPRSNTLDIIARAIGAPERQLYPHYLDCIRAGRERLVHLLQTAAVLLDKAKTLSLDAERDSPGAVSALGIDQAALRHFGPLLGCGIGGLQIARGGTHWVGFGPKSNTVDLDQVPVDVLAFLNLRAFQTSQISPETIAHNLSGLQL
jgi:hypothetical protein